MPLTDQIKNYAKKIVENRPDPGGHSGSSFCRVTNLAARGSASPWGCEIVLNRGGCRPPSWLLPLRQCLYPARRHPLMGTDLCDQ